MTYDIICLVMILIAFAGGFQKGVVRIFGWLIAILLASGTTLWSAPYLLDYLGSPSVGWSSPVPEIMLVVEFALLMWLLTSLMGTLWKPVARKKESMVQNVTGGLMLSGIMVFSIAILSGFFDQTRVISQQTRQQSIAYKILTPIHHTSKKIWINLTSNVSVVHHRYSPRKPIG